MNLQVLKKSRRVPEQGDIFVMRPPDGVFLYGRVISTTAKAGWGFDNSNLIYVYRRRAVEREPVPPLLRNELLVPPMMTNQLPWSRGYFEFLMNRPLGTMDRLPQHCFKRSTGGYYDDEGNELAGLVEPCGQYGLHSFRTIDDEISRALGIPLTPE